MTYGFLAFVDESGSEGPIDQFEFIVVSAVVLRRENYQCLSEIYDKARRLARKSACWQFPKFIKHTSDSQKFLISQLIGQAPLRICTIIAHKPSITSKGMTGSHGDLYFFLSQLLVERISWACRDAYAVHPSGDGTAKILFSERQSLSYSQFQYYVRYLRAGQGTHRSYAAWRHINPDQIEARDPAASDGLRVADFCASAFARAIEHKEFGICDDRFIRPWGEAVYRYNGKTLRNGIKIFPAEAEAGLLAEPRFEWFHNRFKK